MSAVVAALAVAGAVLVWPGSPSRDRSALVRVGRASPLSEPAEVGSAERPAGRRPIPLRAWLAGRGQPASAVEREVIGFVEGLSAALRAGLTPARAFDQLTRSAVARPDLQAGPTAMEGLSAQLAAQAALGARLEPVLRTAARRLGSPALLAVAAGWAMAERHGAPVVDVLDGLGAALRDASRSAAAVETALAAPRATAALLGVLPLGGVVLGELVGVEPLGVLLGTPLGRLALIGGLALTWGGRVWMRRLVSAVGRR